MATKTKKTTRTKTRRNNERNIAEAQIIDRAAQDPTFRAALLKNPKRAISAAFGVKLAKELRIEVMQESTFRKYLVLPEPSEELTDAELIGSVGPSAACISFVNGPRPPKR